MVVSRELARGDAVTAGVLASSAVSRGPVEAGVPRPACGFRHPASGAPRLPFPCPASGVRHPTSYVPRPASRIQSGARCLAPGIPRPAPASGAPCPACGLPDTLGVHARRPLGVPCTAPAAGTQCSPRHSTSGTTRHAPVAGRLHARCPRHRIQHRSSNPRWPLERCAPPPDLARPPSTRRRCFSARRTRCLPGPSSPSSSPPVPRRAPRRGRRGRGGAAPPDRGRLRGRAGRCGDGSSPSPPAVGRG